MYNELLLATSFVRMRKRRRLKSLKNAGIKFKTQLQRRRLLRKFLKLLALRRKKEESKKRRWWVRPFLKYHNQYGAWVTGIRIMREEDPDLFYRQFRMTPSAFDTLLELVGPHLEKRSWRTPICAGERLAITLKFLASGDSFRSLEGYFYVAEETISNIVFETSAVLWAVLKKNVFEPLTEEMWLRKAAEFDAMWNMPHCVGAIDGKHVHIHAPPWSGSRYRNYKGFFSSILMAVCDAKLKLLVVDVGSSGRRGDGNVFHNSQLGAMLREKKLSFPTPCHVEGIDGNMPFFFVGDAAFSRGTHMITPYKGKFLPPDKKVCNYRISRARRNIENVFAMLYKRFEVFQRPLQCSFAQHKSLILACCCLHNFHLMDEESVRPKKSRSSRYVDYTRNDGVKIYGRFKNENPELERATLASLKKEVADAKAVGKQQHLKGDDVSEALIDYFLDYDVPWQWKSAGVSSSNTWRVENMEP